MSKNFGNYPVCKHPFGLTDRELQCLERAANGMSNPQIAASLWLSEDTVKTHMRRLYRKLGANDRAHATKLAIDNGLLGGTPEQLEAQTIEHLRETLNAFVGLRITDRDVENITARIDRMLARVERQRSRAA